MSNPVHQSNDHYFIVGRYRTPPFPVSNEMIAANWDLISMICEYHPGEFASREAAEQFLGENLPEGWSGVVCSPAPLLCPEWA